MPSYFTQNSQFSNCSDCVKEIHHPPNRLFRDGDRRECRARGFRSWDSVTGNPRHGCRVEQLVSRETKGRRRYTTAEVALSATYDIASRIAPRSME